MDFCLTNECLSENMYLSAKDRHFFNNKKRFKTTYRNLYLSTGCHFNRSVKNSKVVRGVIPQVILKNHVSRKLNLQLVCSAINLYLKN